MNKIPFQKQIFMAIALCSMLASSSLYCPPQKAVTYDEAMAKAQTAQEKHTKALAQADKYLREANKYRAQARQIKMGRTVKPMPASVQQEMLPEEELEMPVTIMPVELETPGRPQVIESITATETLEMPGRPRVVESITPSKTDVYEEALSVSTPIKAKATRAR
jgi:hypothetical protein